MPNFAEEPRWRSLLAIEDEQTVDGRIVHSIAWRHPPLPLLAPFNPPDKKPIDPPRMRVAGRIDRIWREGKEIWGEGDFVDDDFGTAVTRLIRRGSLIGVEIDTWNKDCVCKFDLNEWRMEIGRAEILGATLGSNPAFPRAEIDING